MTIEEIVKFGADIAVFEDRGADSSYAEFVFNSVDTPRWEAILSEHLGAVAKPAGAKPTSEQSELTRPFGGVYKDQTLFHHKSAQAEFIAMFWPWQNGQQTTLKLAKLR